MNTPNNELQIVGEEIGQGIIRAHKACAPCRTRKVKCDAEVVGIPCTSCTNRKTTEQCALLNRKVRKIHNNWRVMRISPSQGYIGVIPFIPSSSRSQNLTRSKQPSRPTEPKQLPQSSPADTLNNKITPELGPPLPRLNILNEDVKETIKPTWQHASSGSAYHPGPGDSFTPRNFHWRKLPELDDIDNEYIVKRGVFDLPPLQHMDTLVKIYFDQVYPFAPVINRHDFIRRYQSGDCSLFLLHVILTPAAVHAPADVLSACGFSSRSAAQASFFTKAKLLHDFATEEDQLLVLQGAIIFCTVILDHPSERDFGFWFHTAIGLATMLDLRSKCAREDKPQDVLKVYRRTWWALYSLDTFHVFANTRRSRLLEYTSSIKPKTEDGWDEENGSEVLSGLVSPVTPQQRAYPVALCELSRIVGDCLSTVKSNTDQDPRQIMCQLDTWRKSLASKMHLGIDIEDNIYYIYLKALSYRFECILCRLTRRLLQKSGHAEWSGWAKQRHRSAMLELDAITMRVFASDTLQNFPATFITTITALLARHIEIALDSSETQLARSMARISISQTMLVLTQRKEIPAVKRALPVFEDILANNNLSMVGSGIHGPAPTQSQSRMANATASSHTEVTVAPSPGKQLRNNSHLYGDFLGLDFMDD